MHHECVAVTGATGFVGRWVVRELLGRGRRVRALARDARKARSVLPAGEALTLVGGDVFDAAVMADLTAGCSAMIHLIGIIRERPGGVTFQRLHVEATRAAIGACRASGLRRFLHMSALNVSDEGRTKYQKTKWAAEELVRRSGLEWTIFRPSLIHGPDGEFVQLVKGWASGERPPYRFIPYFKRPVTDGSVPLGPTHYEVPSVQPVWVGDVARAFAEALERPEAVGEVYHLAGPEAMPITAMLCAFRDALPSGDETLRPCGIPADLASWGAAAAAKVGLGDLMPFDAGMALMGAEDSTTRLEKAEHHLGFRPRTLGAALAEYAARV